MAATGWERELDDRKRTGRTGPEPLPHPDHIVIDSRAGTIKFKGPLTKEDKARWDKLRQAKADYDDEIADLKQILKKKPQNIEFFQAHLDRMQRLRDKICTVIPD